MEGHVGPFFLLEVRWGFLVLLLQEKNKVNCYSDQRKFGQVYKFVDGFGRKEKTSLGWAVKSSAQTGIGLHQHD